MLRKKRKERPWLLSQNKNQRGVGAGTKKHIKTGVTRAMDDEHKQNTDLFPRKILKTKKSQNVCTLLIFLLLLCHSVISNVSKPLSFFLSQTYLHSLLNTLFTHTRHIIEWSTHTFKYTKHRHTHTKTHTHTFSSSSSSFSPHHRRARVSLVHRRGSEIVSRSVNKWRYGEFRPLLLTTSAALTVGAVSSGLEHIALIWSLHKLTFLWHGAAAALMVVTHHARTCAHLGKIQQSLRERRRCGRCVGWRPVRMMVVEMWDSGFTKVRAQSSLKLPMRWFQISFCLMW